MNNQHTEHETEIARLRDAITEALSHLEHFAHANAQYNPDALSAYSILSDAIASTPDTPPAGVTGSGALVAKPAFKLGDVVKDRQGNEYRISSVCLGDTQDRYLYKSSFIYALEGVNIERNIKTMYEYFLLDWTKQSAAMESTPAPRKRYIWERHETSKFRYCVWDDVEKVRLQIPGENFLWTTLPRVKRECERLNAAPPASGSDTVAGSGNGGEA